MVQVVCFQQHIAILSVSKDRKFIGKINGVQEVLLHKYQAKAIPEYNVFISHANRDKEELVEDLYKSLDKLGIQIFYDKESIEWEIIGKIRY